MQAVQVACADFWAAPAGFESCTAFAAEAKNPRRDIPRAVPLALIIQGLVAYLFEYFSASFAVSDKLTFTQPDGTVVTGWDAAGASAAPIGDMIQLIGNSLLGGIGFGLMIVIAITVALAILGTTLSAMNTGVRITYAMAQDAEMPDPLALLMAAMRLHIRQSSLWGSSRR